MASREQGERQGGRVRRVKEVGDALVLLHTGTDGKSKVKVAAMEVGALCMVATHRPRAGLRGILSNTCRVTE